MTNKILYCQEAMFFVKDHVDKRAESFTQEREKKMIKMIETPRSIIRVPDQGDLEILYSIHSDPLANIYNPGWTETNREEFKRFFDTVIAHHKQHGFGYYVLVDKEDHKVFGLCGLRYTSINDTKYLNLYYRIDPLKTRRGFVKEAAREIIDLVLKRSGHKYRVVALTSEDNVPSRKTAESLGLKYDPRLDHLGGEGNVYYFSETPIV